MAKKLSDLHLRSFNEVTCKEVPWLFYPYLARGEITILSADPGSGKTLFATWLAARVSGGEYPVYSERNQSRPGKILFLSKEDHYDYTIVPRYLACSGDPERCFYLPFGEMPASFADPVINSLMELKPDLLVFDAISSFSGCINMNNAAEVRNLLLPLYSRIEGTATAVLLIAHNNKMAGVSSAQYRLSGSVDFAALARSCLTIARNPDREESYVLAQYKNNIGPIGSSLTFDLHIQGEMAPGLVFSGFSELGADELLRKGSGSPASTLISETADELIRLLKESGGKLPARKVIARLKEKGYSESTIQRARGQSGIYHTITRDSRTGRNISIWCLRDNI